MNRSSAKIIKFPVQQQKTKQHQTHYLWDGNRQLQEQTDTHVFTTIYEQDSFEPVARLVWLQDGVSIAANDDPDDEVWTEPKQPASLQVYHFHNDHLGTPNELTDDKGEVVWLADYEAWGNVNKVVYTSIELSSISFSADEHQPLRFQGQFIDQETGLHYNRFRYFDPDLEMFTTRDPIGLLGGNNVFQYAPNPTGWIDPWGLARGRLGSEENPYQTSRAARRAAMREAGIPTSQQPISQSQNASGREYTYRVTDQGGREALASVQQQTMDSSHLEQPHWEAGKVKTDPLTGETRMTNYNRPKLQNDKGKAYYDESGNKSKC